MLAFLLPFFNQTIETEQLSNTKVAIATIVATVLLDYSVIAMVPRIFLTSKTDFEHCCIALVCEKPIKTASLINYSN